MTDSAVRGLVEAVADAYERGASTATNSLLCDPVRRAELLRHIAFVLGECAAGLRGAPEPVNHNKAALVCSIGVTATAVGLDEEGLARIWTELFDALLEHVPRIVAELGPGSGPAPETTVVKVLHRAIAERSRASAAWHATAMAHLTQRTIAEERKAIARDLHDQFGGDLSVIQRRLELHRAHAGVDADDRHLAVAERVVAELLDGVRRYAAGLRVATSVDDLRAGLDAYVSSVANADTTVQVLLRGDSALLPASARDELFMILREAIRNVFAHAAARHVVVLVEVLPDRAFAVVNDDGVGFSTLPSAKRAGSGLLSMKERAEGLGGDLVIDSMPGHGTRIGCWIPIGGPEGRDGQAVGSATTRARTGAADLRNVSEVTSGGLEGTWSRRVALPSVEGESPGGGSP